MPKHGRIHHLTIGFLTCLAALFVVSSAKSVPISLDWGSYDIAGGNNFGVYSEDDSTVLETHDFVALMWAGDDEEIAPPNCMGEPTGDDLILDVTSVKNGVPLPLAHQNKGYIPLKTFTFSSNNTQLNGILYLRAWNAYSPLAATAYGDTAPTSVPEDGVLMAERWHTEQAFESCGDPPPPPGKDSVVYLPLLHARSTSLNMTPSKNINQLAPDSFGGGGYEFGHEQHLTDDQRADIQAQIDANIKQLEADNIQPFAYSPTAVSLQWPLLPSASFDDFSYYGISNFVDHNAAFPNQLSDYMCGDRSYDTSNGYNHQGTDFFLWPNQWQMMADDTVTAVAAAPGVIVHKQDGNNDMSCSSNNSPWNAVYVQHGDGSVAWYGHLKKGSLTSKNVGQTVVAGEFLGVVGSSGNSTDPHLHFELYDSDGNLLDPYAGTCNALNSESLWAEQRPYYDSAVNKVMTGAAIYEINSCPNTDTTYEQNEFMPGDTIAFSTFYRDQLDAQQSLYTIYRPNGSIYQQWTHNGAEPHYPASYWWWTREINAGEAHGEWRFVVTFAGKTYQHEFLVGNAPTPAEVTTLQLTHAADDLQLAWTAVSKDKNNQQLTVDSYNIYRSSDPYFEPSADTLYATVTSPSFQDVDTAVSDEAVYYRITAVNQFGGESAPSEAVGAVPITVHPGWNLLSAPLLPLSAGLDTQLGNGLHGTADPTSADRILIWDSESQSFNSAWFCSGAGCELYGSSYNNHWLASDYAPSTLTIQPGSGFWLQNRSGAEETLWLTGLVPTANRLVSVSESWQLLGSTLPLDKTIDSLDIPATGAESPETADTILNWNPLTQTFESAWFCSGSQCETFGVGYTDRWLDENNTLSNMLIPVGHGFWFHNQHAPFTWTNETP